MLAAAIAAATIAALLTTASSASADGGTQINGGPGQYNLDFSHPKGTISIGGGTISARCTASSFVGSAVFFTPQCTTRAITCPATAAFCSIVVNAQENALRGPVAFYAQVSSSNGFSNVGGAPYACSSALHCSWGPTADVPTGSVLQGEIINTAAKPGWPNVFLQITMTVH